jgi:hypothetical protein
MATKTGGRSKGTPNKRTQDVIDKLDSLDCDPIEGMARIAQQAEADGDKNLAAQMYKELAPYVAPKRKAIETTIKNEWEGASRKELEENFQEEMRQVIKEFQALPEREQQAIMEPEGNILTLPTESGVE